MRTSRWRFPQGLLDRAERPVRQLRKVPWFRDSRAFGELRVRGIRRPGRDRLAKTKYDNHLGPESEVVPGALYFPRTGCWHITGKSGEAKRVVRIK
jgi:hypothetical protein